MTGSRWKHKKTGGAYTVLFAGRMQMEDPRYDLKEVVVYRSEALGSVWVRLQDEFLDGRFERCGP